MAETASIIGGGTVTFADFGSSAELTAAKNALAGLSGTFLSGQVLHTLGGTETPGGLDVRNIDSSVTGGTYTMGANEDAVVLLGTGDEHLNGRAGSLPELLVGNDGNDTINAAGGNGTIVAADGYNEIQLNADGTAGGNVSIFTGLGDDTVNLWGGNATITGQPGYDPLVNAWSGNNVITGQSSLLVDLEGGNDTVNLNAGGEVDIINGGVNATVNFGATPGTVNFTGSGNDTVTINGNNDTVNIASGSNSITGNGNLKFVVTGGDSSVTLEGGTQTVQENGGSAVFNLVGNDTVNVLRSAGDTNSNVAIHHDGADNDSIHAFGNDTIFLGSGNDTISDGGNATIYAGSGSLTLKGSPGDHVVYGGSGNLSLAGGSGNNAFYGAAGNDTLQGGSGRTTMQGGGGNNTFIAGTGSDTMDGFGGTSNVFDFNSALSAVASGTTTHTISSFVEGRDLLKMEGSYSVADALANATVKNGNTYISLDGGHTKIVLVNFTHLTSSDFTS